MKRVSPSKKIADSIRNALTEIERQEEHDENKVSKAIQRLQKHGGVDIHMGDHFEVKNYGGEEMIASPAGAQIMMIGKTKPSLKGNMYIIGREPNNNRELVYYKISGSNISKRDCGQRADITVSRFDLALIPSGDRVEIFNLGANKTDLYFEGEIEF